MTLLWGGKLCGPFDFPEEGVDTLSKSPFEAPDSSSRVSSLGSSEEAESSWENVDVETREVVEVTVVDVEVDEVIVVGGLVFGVVSVMSQGGGRRVVVEVEESENGETEEDRVS